jgi:phosphatidylinositol alpha-1,6-mannosyltransferase
LLLLQLSNSYLYAIKKRHLSEAEVGGRLPFSILTGKTMRIGLVCDNYLPFLGGVEIHVRQLAQELSGKHEVTVAAMNFVANRLPRRLRVLHTNLLAPVGTDKFDEGVPVHSLCPGFTDRLMMLPLALRAMPRVQRWFYHEINRWTHPFYAKAIVPKMLRCLRGCDVVHGLCHGDIGWAAEKTARLLGVPFLCTPFVHPHQWGDGPNDVAFYRRADAVVGLLESDRAYLEKIGVPAAKLRVIGVSPYLPPSADGSAFRRKQELDGSPMVLYVGRMMRQKGAFAVLEAAERVWQNHPTARFFFVGPADAEEKRMFEGRDRRITYLGKVSLQEKADALAACDVFCMPSTSEILPTVYLEAWSLGKPVVGGTAPGLRELVEENQAGMCSRQDPAELACLLSRILADTGLKNTFGANGRDLVTRSYSVKAVVGQLAALYESINSRLQQRN